MALVFVRWVFDFPGEASAFALRQTLQRSARCTFASERVEPHSERQCALREIVEPSWSQDPYGLIATDTGIEYWRHRPEKPSRQVLEQSSVRPTRGRDRPWEVGAGRCTSGVPEGQVEPARTAPRNPRPKGVVVCFRAF